MSYYQTSLSIRKTSSNVKVFRNGYTLAIIDCSWQTSPIKSDTVDVRLEFEFKENVSANTTIYCLILHDRLFEYSLLPNVVGKIT